MSDEYVTRAEYHEFTKRQDDWNARQDKRISEVEGQTKVLQDLSAAVQVQTAEIKHLATKTQEQGNSVEKLSNTIEQMRLAPADKWEKAKITVITALLSGLVGLLIGALTKLL